MFYNRKRYSLVYNNETVEILEPNNWNEVTRTVSRNENYHGIVTTISDTLEFFGSAKDFLSTIFSVAGVNANVRLILEEKDEDTDIFETVFVGYLDFFTLELTTTTCSIKCNADNYTTRLKAKQGVKVDLEVIQDLYGNPIDPMNIDSLYLEGQDLLQVNRLATTKDTPIQIMTTVDWNPARMSILLEEIGENLESGNIDVYSVSDGLNTRVTDYEYGSHNFIGRNSTGSPMTVKINVQHKQSIMPYTNNPSHQFTLDFRIARYDVNDDFVATDKSWRIHQGTASTCPVDIDISVSDLEIVVGVNESVSFEMYLTSNEDVWVWGGDITSPSDGLPAFDNGEPIYHPISKYKYLKNGSWITSYMESSVVVYTNTVRQPTQVSCANVNDMFEQCLKIILGGNITFDADIFRDGGLLYGMVFTHGLWLRGMLSSLDTYQSIAISFRDLYECVDMIAPIGLAIENDKVVVRGRDKFYSKRVTIELYDINDLKITPHVDAYYTGIEIYSERKYEDDQGLDEFNRRVEYSTPIIKTSNTLKLDSKVRSDGYGLETVRRLNPLIDNTKNFEDSESEDKEIWVVDTHYSQRSGRTTLWAVNNWVERFAKAPENVYAPDTVVNLWYSPINILLRHGRFLKAGLLKNLSEWIKYASSEGNSALKTQLIGGNEYTQNIGVPIVDLDKSIGKGVIAEFSALVSFDKITGTTEGIPNVYGTVRFEYRGIEYRGYLLNVEVKNGVGQFKIQLIS